MSCLLSSYYTPIAGKIPHKISHIYECCVQHDIHEHLLQNTQDTYYICNIFEYPAHLLYLLYYNQFHPATDPENESSPRNKTNETRCESVLWLAVSRCFLCFVKRRCPVLTRPCRFFVGMCLSPLLGHSTCVEKL